MKYKRVGPFISINDANKQLFNDNVKYCMRFSMPIPETFLTEIIKINDINFSYEGLTIHGRHRYNIINDNYKYWHPIVIGIPDKTFNNYIFLKE